MQKPRQRAKYRDITINVNHGNSITRNAIERIDAMQNRIPFFS
ncbi:MAG: hypothetical protein U9R65_08160 [Pseudomonadota bacterium]|nr:hypothetical protein [Pseudomonadota bacterium]